MLACFLDQRAAELKGANDGAGGRRSCPTLVELGRASALNAGGHKFTEGAVICCQGR
jgi:hypothetical protein